MLVGYHSLFLALQSLLASVTLLCMKTQAAFQFEVTLNTFTNPENRLDDGECCDVVPFPCVTCDPIFARFCLREFNQTDDNADNCDLGRYDEDNIDVGATIRINHNIPWPGSFQLRFVAEDYDIISANDFIGDVTANVVLNVSDTFVGPVMIISENTRFTVELSFRVTCQQDFYGSDCATFCLARNDTLGHYSCNTLTGDMECLPGYQNVSSSCTVSICHVQCHVIGGFCLIPGECMCNMGWIGSQCDQCIPGEGCSPVGGYCTEPGECLCREGFSGELCSEPICLIQCHVIGGYCLIPGECRCNMGWNGTLCDQCMPAEECFITGGYCVQPFDCICKQGYEGMNCERERTTSPTPTTSPPPSAALAIGHIVGGVVGGLLITILIFILLAIISLLLWKRSGKSVNAGISTTSGTTELVAVNGVKGGAVDRGGSGALQQTNKDGPSAAEEDKLPDVNCSTDINAAYRITAAHRNQRGVEVGHVQQSQGGGLHTVDDNQVLLERHIYDNEDIVFALPNAAYGTAGRGSDDALEYEIIN